MTEKIQNSEAKKVFNKECEKAKKMFIKASNYAN